MKKFYFKQLFAAVLLLCSTVATAHDFEVDGIYYNITSSTALTVAVTYKGSSYSNYSHEYSGSVSIPSTVAYNRTTYSVTSIGNYAFYNCSVLTSITIPSSVTNIGDGAFYNCSGLTSITIPASVTSISNEAFRNCSGLASVTIPASITSISNEAFRNCKGLTSITIPNSVTSIGSSAFYGCTGLTNVIIPSSVTSIGDHAFYNCNLTSVTIPSSVTSIGDHAFDGCNGLIVVYNKSSLNIVKGSSNNGFVAYYANVVIVPGDDTYQTVGDYMFTTIDGVNTLVAYIGSDSKITLPANYNGDNYVIGNKAFGYNTSIISVTIPSSVTSIGNYAFYECRALTSVTIPNGVTSIGRWAFGECDGLTSIIIPNCVTSIGNFAFNNCDGLKVVYNNSSLNIVKGSTDNGDVAYYANAVIVPTDDIQSDFVFRTADGVNTLVLYTGSDSEVALPANYNGENYVIGASAFKDNTSITSVTIPESVTSIGDYAFRYCYGLTSVTIGKGVTSIGDHAFDDCDDLKSVTIGSGVTSIGGEAFRGCHDLTSVTIPNSVTSIGAGAFYYCIGLTSVTIPASVTSIGNYAFHYCYGLTSVTIGKGVTSIGNYAFKSCTALAEIYVESSTPATIDRYTFYGLYEQATLYVPAGAKAAYEAAAYWKNFTIVEQTTTLLGDINSDNKVDVGDVTILIGMILDASLLTDSGDINGDNKVDVGDVTTLVAIILGTNNTPARAAAMEEYNVELSVEGDEQSLTIDATATDYPYSAVQFDVYLPAGVKAIGNIVAGGSTALCKEQADGAVRVVIYSPSNTAIANKSASIAIDATGLALGSHPVEVKNIILAAPGRAKAIAWDSTGYITIAGTTGIDGVVSDAGNADAVVYDLQGHRVTEIVKGRVYIKNGSKFIAQ